MAGERKRITTPAGEPLDVPKYRIATCHRWTHGGGPSLYRSPAQDNSEYDGVYTCGSVWHCPLCAAKITSARRDELIAAVAAWSDRGGEVYLATRTHSHDKKSLELPEQLARFSDVLSKAKGTRRVRELNSRAGVVGVVRALEVTHGEMNGWHPHSHELVFARPGQRGRLLSHRTAYIRQLIKSGLAGMVDGMTRAERAEQLRFLRKHAYTVQSGGKAAEYVAKFGHEPVTDSGGRWGPGSELAKGHTKTGQRLSGRTPFTLLWQYLEGDKRAGMLFRQFAEAFHGRAQIFWSKGLRAELVELCQTTAHEVYFRDGATQEWTAWEARARKIGRERSDDDIAASRSAACTEFVYRLSKDDWTVVLRTDSRHEIKLAAQLDGAEGVKAMLDQLRAQPPTHGAEFVDDWRSIDRRRSYDA